MITSERHVMIYLSDMDSKPGAVDAPPESGPSMYRYFMNLCSQESFGFSWSQKRMAMRLNIRRGLRTRLVRPLVPVVMSL